MLEEQKGVEAETPSALETAIASQPEENQQAQQAQETQTPAKTEEIQEQTQAPMVQEEEPRVPYSRLKEVVDEKNWFKQQLEQQIAQRQQQLQFQQPQQDPYQNMTAEEKIFWQGIDKRIEDRATQIADTKIRAVQPVIDAGRMELAQIKVQQFRNQHPDIKSNSPEEMAIAEKISLGYSPNDAYWSVMGPRGIRNAQSEIKQQVKQQIQTKKLANVETNSSVSSNVKSEPKLSFRERFSRNLDLAEQGKI